MNNQQILDEYWQEIKEAGCLYKKTPYYYYVLFMHKNKPWQLELAKTRKELVLIFMNNIGNREKLNSRMCNPNSDVHMTMAFGFMENVVDYKPIMFENEFFDGPDNILIMPTELKKAERKDLGPYTIAQTGFKHIDFITVNSFWAENHGVIGP
jgi:hypothetical protein